MNCDVKMWFQLLKIQVVWFFLGFGFVVSPAENSTIQMFCLLQNANLGKEVTFFFFFTFTSAFQQWLFKYIYCFRVLKCRE